MCFEIVLLPAMIIMGAELRTTYQNNQCFTDIPAFWEQNHMNDAIAKIPNKVKPDVILGVYTNYTSDFSLTSGYYSLIIGSPVNKQADSIAQNSIPNGMIIKEIPASKYAVFTAKGPFSSAIPKAWQEIWQNKDINRTFTSDFEWYDSNSTDDDNSVVKIYVAIK